MRPRSVIVIGAGIGGITAAIHLAKQGLKVTMLEKNAHSGGRCDRFNRDGHIFDTGPTLFVMPLLYEEEFRTLGLEIRQRLDLQQVDPTYHLVFNDGSRLSLTSDMDSMRTQLETLEPGSFQGLQRYLSEGERHYRLVLEKLVNRNFHKVSELVNPRNVSLLWQIKPLVNHYRNMSAYFREPRLKSAFTFQDIYTGLSPFDAPATFSMMPYTELAHGVWYPRGGMYSIVETLVDIAHQSSVDFVYNACVEQVQVNSTHVHGVLLADGTSIGADIVLANADLPYVYKDLLPEDKSTQALTRKRFSCSVISFFWGVDKRYEALGPHTLFISGDYRRNFMNIEQGKGLPADPSLYVHAPARLDGSMAPPGQDTLIAIVPVGHMDGRREQDWNANRELARQHVFRRLRGIGITDLEAHIKFEESFTPLSWSKRYNLEKGATHGLSHQLTQMACFRPSNRHPRYSNLYFVGASTHPGTGIPTAMVSGRLVSERIREDHL